MDSLQRIKSSRKAYCSHLRRIFRKVDEILEKEPPITEPPITEPQAVTLTSSLEQLTQKKKLFQQLYNQIAEPIQTSDDKYLKLK